MDKSLLAKRIAPWSLMALAVVWGSSFFSIKRLVLHLPVTDFLAMRFLISTVVLLIVLHRSIKMPGKVWLRGCILGAVWAAGQLLQTAGLARTTASLCGFITGLYVVFTPILGLLLFKLRVNRWVWVGVALSLVGLAVLTIRPDVSGSGLGAGELLTVASAIVYAGHIALLGRWSTPKDVPGLTVAQGVSMTPIFLIFAAPGGIQVPTNAVDWIWLIYLATICGAVSILVQTWAQGHMDASKAAVIMCSEPLWATFFAVLFGGEYLTWMFAIGAVAILASMYLVIKPPGGQIAQAATPSPLPAPSAPPPLL